MENPKPHLNLSLETSKPHLNLSLARCGFGCLTSKSHPNLSWNNQNHTSTCHGKVRGALLCKYNDLLQRWFVFWFSKFRCLGSAGSAQLFNSAASAQLFHSAGAAELSLQVCKYRATYKNPSVSGSTLCWLNFNLHSDMDILRSCWQLPILFEF